MDKMYADRINELISNNKLEDAIKNCNNLIYMKYTMLHREQFFKTERKITGGADEDYQYHDMDKPILYMFLDKKSTQKLHRQMNRHHDRTAKDRKSLIEMIIDWECARFSKPDKPLNARDTMYKYYPEMEDVIVPLLNEFGINKPSDGTSITMEEFNRMAEAVTVKIIATAIMGYMKRGVAVEA